MTKWRFACTYLGQFYGRYYLSVRSLATIIQPIPCTFRTVPWQVLCMYQHRRSVGDFYSKSLHIFRAVLWQLGTTRVKHLATFFQLIPCTFRAVLWQVLGTFSWSRVRFPAAARTFFFYFPPIFPFFCSLQPQSLEADLNDICKNGYIVLAKNSLNSSCFSAISRFSLQFLAHLGHFCGRYIQLVPGSIPGRASNFFISFSLSFLFWLLQPQSLDT